MAQKNETPLLIASLFATLLLLGGGVWWFMRDSGDSIRQGLSQLTPSRQNSNSQGRFPPISPTTPGNAPSPNTLPNAPLPEVPNPGLPAQNGFSLPDSVPAGTIVRVNGSTSMAQIGQLLKQGFQKQFPGTEVDNAAEGTDRGIQRLLAGETDLAGISRPLSAPETNRGLASVPIAQDAIALTIGLQNPFQGSLSSEQVKGIFEGKLTDWSAVGGGPGPIQVINRPGNSGTHQAFQEMVLKGGNFGTTANIQTMDRDATTPMLRLLGTQGIGYATYAQVANQQTVRVVPIDGLLPSDPNYPYKRVLSYAYRQPANLPTQAFLGYALSPEGRQAMTGKTGTN